MPQQTQAKTVREKFDQIIIDQLRIDEPPPDSANLYDDCEADSFDIIEIAMAIEDEMDITIDDGDLEDAVTIGQLFRLVEKAAK